MNMENLGKFYINGAWIAPKSSLVMPVLNPATELQIGSVALGSAADVDTAVAAATWRLSVIPKPARRTGWCCFTD